MDDQRVGQRRRTVAARRPTRRPAPLPPIVTPTGTGGGRRRGTPVPHRSAETRHRPRRPDRRSRGSTATTPIRASRHRPRRPDRQRRGSPLPHRSAQADTDRDGLTDGAEAAPLPHEPAQATPIATDGAIEPDPRRHEPPRPAQSPEGLEVSSARTTRGGICTERALVRGLRRLPAPDDELAGPMTSDNNRLAVIIVSHNSASWLAACLSSVYAKSGNLDLDVVVVDSGSTDDTVDLVRREFPGRSRRRRPRIAGSRLRTTAGSRVVDAEWVLFLNPDTRILSGTLEELVSLLRARPTVGLAGVRQIDENGVMDPTMRRFPECRPLALREPRRRTASVSASWLGERVLDLDLYDRETACDWTVGSFMLAAQGGDRRRRRDGRAVLPLLRGDRLLPSDATGRVGRRPSPPDDDPPPEQHDGLGRAAERADGVRPTAVHGEALRDRPQRSRRRSHSASGMRSARSRPAAVRTPPATRLRSLRARDTSRARAAAVRLSVGGVQPRKIAAVAEGPPAP